MPGCHADHSRSFGCSVRVGLFGLLGDARVQIVVTSETAKLQAFVELAKKGERMDPLAIKQDLCVDYVDYACFMEWSLKCCLKETVRESADSAYDAPGHYVSFVYADVQPSQIRPRRRGRTDA